MIEFDVLRAPDGRLVLAHDYEDAAGRDACSRWRRGSTTSPARLRRTCSSTWT